MSHEQVDTNESLQPGDAPTGTARCFAWLTWVARPALFIYWPLLFFLTHAPESPSLNSALKSIEHVHPDKWAHVATYMLLTVLLVFTEFAGRRAHFIVNLTLGCVIAGIYAFVDELTQGMYGRTVSGADVTADLAAVAMVYVSLLLIHPQGRALPKGVLIARILLAIIVPMAGVMLFNERVGTGIDVWRIVPDWMGYIRGDYVAHFVCSFGATLLLGATAPLGTGPEKARINALFTLTVMAITAPLIEWMQFHFSDRGAEWRDVQAHIWGMFAATIIWFLWMVVMKVMYATGLLHGPVFVKEQFTATMGNNPGAATSASTGDPNKSASQPFVGHALIISLMTLLSRFTGLVRDSVLAAALGLSATADAFSIGFLIPNLFRRLFGEGALTAAFIPIYTELVQRDRLTARRLASLCIAVMLVFLGGLTLVGELVLLAMISATQWSSDTALALRLTMIMLPYMPMICIVALVGGILQVHGRFGAPAAAPIFLNLVMIAGTIAAVKVAGGIETEASITHAVVIISWTVLVAGLVQLLWQLAMVMRVEKFTTVFTGAGPAFRRMLSLMVPMFIGLGVFQINTLGDYLIAFLLSAKTDGPTHLHIMGMTLDYPMTTGDVAALTWAQRLYQFPLGVFGIAIATAIFPALSRAAAGMSPESKVQSPESGNSKAQSGGPSDDSGLRTLDSGLAPSGLTSEFSKILHHGLRLTFFIGLPASVGLILLRVPITRLIFERGEFGLAESQRVAMVMVGYCAVVWAYSMTHVLTRAFYAVKDSRTPLRISLAMVALNLVLNLALIWPMGVAGLAWASAVCAVLQVILMVRALRKVVPVVVSSDVLAGWKITTILSLAMTLVLLPITIIFDAAAMTRTQSAIQLGILLPVGALIVLGGAWLLQASELQWLRKRSVK